MTDWHLGTMGFGYREWVGAFYPAGTPPRNFLAHYSQLFDAVGIDSTFYGAPGEAQVKRCGFIQAFKRWTNKLQGTAVTLRHQMGCECRPYLCPRPLDSASLFPVFYVLATSVFAQPRTRDGAVGWQTCGEICAV